MLGLSPAYRDNLCFKDPAFREAEEVILQNREAYLAEARDLRFEFVKGDAELFLDGILLKAAENRNSLSAGERRQTINVVDALRKLQNKKPVLPGENDLDAEILAKANKNS